MIFSDEYVAPLFITDDKAVKDWLNAIYLKHFSDSKLSIISCENLAECFEYDLETLDIHDVVVCLCHSNEHKHNLRQLSDKITIWNYSYQY